MISPCGASILLHVADPEKRSLVTRFSNAKTRNDVPPTERDLLSAIIDRSREMIMKASIAEAGVASAELKSIILYYNQGLKSAKNDSHYLIASDTWLGDESAELVKTWMTSQGMNNVIKERINDLQTGELDAFNCSLSELLQRFYGQENQLQKYHVVFNLTGGFKAIQGFMQIIAMLYGNETIYVFERSDELMRIPALPIRIDADNVIRNNLSVFRRLALELPTDFEGVIPESLVMRIGNTASLSIWAGIVWNKVKNTIYSEKVWEAPSPRIRFTDTFRKSVQSLPPDRIGILNRRLDDLARCIEKGLDYNLRSLDLKPLQGKPIPGSTHEIDAWSDKSANRLFCHYEENVIVIDSLSDKLKG